jgi:probable HAF family extracellular repeat protein
MPIHVFNAFDVPSAFTGTTEAWGVNNGIQIVGFYDNATGRHGFLESGGTYTTLDDPLATNGTQAFGINASGQIVGQYQTGPVAANHGFLLSGGTYTTLDVPLAFFTVAQGINSAGQIVGYYLDGGGEHGFLFNGGGYTPLDVPSALAGTTRAFGINASGQIVGRFQGATGQHGFLLTGGLTPPSTIRWPPRIPSPTASTIWARSSGRIMTPAAPIPSSIAGALSPPSMLPLRTAELLHMASTTTARSPVP